MKRIVAVLVLMGAGPTLEAGFATAVNSGVGSGPASVALGDFNRDGRVDLVVANQDSDDVSIRIGNPNGTFQPEVAYGTAAGPQSAAVGDFNGDGKLDLALACAATVSTLLGNGNGTFQAKVDHAAGTGPRSVAVGDFNGDGKLDLAVANNGSDDVSILLGGGDGSFAKLDDYDTAAGPEFVAVGDFDGDGRADLAVAAATTVSILPGAGDGSFPTFSDYAAGTGPRSVAISDFNRDGALDLAVANNGSGDVSFLQGAGDGTFAGAFGFATGTNPTSVAASDFNRDGKADLAVTNAGTNRVSVLLGDGSGSFASAVNYGTGNSPSAVAVGDFNGDGEPDLVTTNQSQDTVSVLLNNDSATVCACQAAVNYGTGGTSPIALASGDFNRDGKLDLAVTNAGASSQNVVILTGSGTGSFTVGASYGIGNTPYAMAVGDFNRDGRKDLVVTNATTGTASILLGNGDATFSGPVNFSAVFFPLSVAVGDFNADGRQDLAVAMSQAVAVLLGNGDGSFAAPVSYGEVNTVAVAVADFNRDGRQDLVVTGGGSKVQILLGNGNGTFQAPVTQTAGPNPNSVTVGDFNRDGRPDVAVTNTLSNTISVLLGNGDGTLQAATNYTVQAGPLYITATDLDADGKADLAVSGQSRVFTLRGNGDGTFQTPVQYTAGLAPQYIAPADYNGDGKMDLAVPGQSSNNLSVLLGACKYVTTSTLLSSLNPSAYGQAVTFTANVTSGTGGSGVPTGTVTFKDGATTLGSQALSSGSATFQTSALLGGTHSITAVYGGDASFAPSTSAAVSQVVQASANLSVTKTDGQTTAVPGSPLTYTITVSNGGPDATGATVTDPVPAALTGASWTCGGAGGGTCAGGGSGDITDTVELPAGGSVTYTLTGTVDPTATGSLGNTATATVPAGVTDPAPGNESATDNDILTPVVDLSVTKTDGLVALAPGASITYTIVVANSGPSTATGATVADTVPAAITGATWACAAAGGATCTANGSGNINDIVSLPAGGSLTYTLSGTISPAATGTLDNTATVTAPGGTTDSNPANDSATDTDSIDLVFFKDGFESGTLAAWSHTSTDGGDLSVSAAAALNSTSAGLFGLIDDTAGLYVQDDSPNDEDRYRARFYFSTNDFDPGEANGARRTRLFILFEETPNRRLAAIVLRRLDGAFSLRGRARLDDNSQADTAFFPITPGEHFVELSWLRSSGTSANDGSLQLWIDGSPVSTLTGLDNSRSAVDFVRLGALSVKEGASGTLSWDEFESRRLTYIGPAIP